MTDLTVVDLSDAQKAVQESDNSPETAEELEQAHDLGEIVHVDGEGDGIVASVMTEKFTWPTDLSEDEAKQYVEDTDIATGLTDDGNIKINPSEESPAYIIALEEGGSVLATPDEVSGDGSISGDGEEISSWKEAVEKGSEAELAAIYEEVDDPSNYAELQATKKRMIQERQAADLADYVEENDVSLDELEAYSSEELANIPGVDDPEVGFASMPNGWSRKSVLQAWASLGGMWRTCYARMIREMGPNMARRWCSALKDEVLQTEQWRNSF